MNQKEYKKLSRREKIKNIKIPKEEEKIYIKPPDVDQVTKFVIIFTCIFILTVLIIGMFIK